MFYILDENEHRTYPYNTIETFCMNTDNTKKIISSLITLLHVVPSRCDSQSHPFLKKKIASEDDDETVKSY